LLAPIILFSGFLINEILLIRAQHEPSIVSNSDLFCAVYRQVNELSKRDVVLLGASRMQTGIDLDVIQQHLPKRQALMLATSGMGTSYPVFRDLVHNTDFSGIVIIDENEHTLTSDNHAQQELIDHCNHNFSTVRRLNRHIATFFQHRFLFLNPQSNSLRLWGNLLVEREFPEPFYTKTLPDRQQLVDYERAEPTMLQLLHDERLKAAKHLLKQKPLPPDEWLELTGHWGTLIQQFEQRGGKVIFVRMPVSDERWKFERQFTPVESYWQHFAQTLQVEAVHFSEFSNLSNFNLADTSHLSMHDKRKFTQLLMEYLQSHKN
jgi:hypothetical protein